MKNNILEGEQFSAHLKKLNQFGLNINLNMKKTVIYLDQLFTNTLIEPVTLLGFWPLCSCVFYFKMLLFDWQIGALSLSKFKKAATLLVSFLLYSEEHILVFGTIRK